MKTLQNTHVQALFVMSCFFGGCSDDSTTSVTDTAASRGTEGTEGTEGNDNGGDMYPTTGDPCEFTDYKPGIYWFECWNENDPTEGMNKASYPPSSDGDYENNFIQVHACADVVPGGSFQDMDAAVREQCSNMCDWFDSPRICEDSRWSSWNVIMLNGYPGCVVTKCTEETGPPAVNVIEEVLGAQAAADALDLPCNLPFDCGSYLTGLEASGMYSEPLGDLEDTASVQVASNAVSVAIVGYGASTGPNVPMVGNAAFSPTPCGADACPFYLAQFDLAASAPFTVPIVVLSTPGAVPVDVLALGLDRPALGMWLPGSGDVIFPPRSLTMRVTSTVNSTPYDTLHQIGGYVFGTYDSTSGEFVMAATGNTTGATFNLTSQFLP